MIGDCEKPVAIARQALNARALEPGERDDAVRGDDSAFRRAQSAVCDVDSVGVGHHLDAAFDQQRGDRVARRRSELCQRSRLRRHDGDAYVRPSPSLEPRGGEHGKLVERQHPSRVAGHGERNQPRAAGFELVDQRSKCLAVVAPLERQRAGERLDRAAAAGDHECVVFEHIAPAGRELSRQGIHCGQSVPAVPSALSPEQLAKREPVERPCGERLDHGERAIDEVAFGSDDLDVHETVRQLAQCEHRLETGHAGAGDDYAIRPVRHQSSLRLKNLYRMVERRPPRVIRDWR